MGGEIREGFLEEMVADLRCGGHVGVIWVEGGGEGCSRQSCEVTVSP